MARVFDPALPIERPLADSLVIYAKRFGLLLAVAMGNAMLLLILCLNAKYPVFSAAAICCLIAAVILLAIRPDLRSVVVIGAAFKWLDVLQKLPRFWNR